MWINSSICLIFPTCVLHSSIICMNERKQAQKMFSASYVQDIIPIAKICPAIASFLSTWPGVSHSLWHTYDSLSPRNTINGKSFRQWLTSPLRRHAGELMWIVGTRVRWRVSVYLWHRSQSLGGCLLLFCPLLCSLQDVLEQQTTTFYFWTNSINWTHFFHLIASDRDEVSFCVCLWPTGQRVWNQDWKHSTKQSTVMNSCY